MTRSSGLAKSYRNGAEFFDTNILVYAFDPSAARKQPIAQRLMTRLRSEGRGCLSMQVLQEFYNASRRKAKAPTGDVAAEIERLAQLPLQRPDLEDPLAAIRPPEAETISFRDALIVRSALEMGCHFHWTEDLQHGRWFGDLVIRNPFAA